MFTNPRGSVDPIELYYQAVLLEVLYPWRLRAHNRGQLREWAHEAGCIGLGTELYSYQARDTMIRQGQTWSLILQP